MLHEAVFSKVFVLCDADESSEWADAAEIIVESNAVTASYISSLSPVSTADIGRFYKLIVCCVCYCGSAREDRF